MKELSLHILDLAQNSISAGATLVTISVIESKSADSLIMSIEDNGRGMSAEFLARVTDPFTTTRTTRKVGLGLPLFKLAAEACGGSLEIESEVGKGTKLKAAFGLSHIDRAPVGDMADTMSSIIQGHPEIDYVYIRCTDKGEFRLATSEMKEILGDADLSAPEVLSWLRDYIKENEAELDISL